MMSMWVDDQKLYQDPDWRLAFHAMVMFVMQTEQRPRTFLKDKFDTSKSKEDEILFYRYKLEQLKWKIHGMASSVSQSINNAIPGF